MENSRCWVTDSWVSCKVSREIRHCRPGPLSELPGAPSCAGAGLGSLSPSQPDRTTTWTRAKGQGVRRQPWRFISVIFKGWKERPFSTPTPDLSLGGRTLIPKEARGSMQVAGPKERVSSEDLGTMTCRLENRGELGELRLKARGLQLPQGQWGRRTFTCNISFPSHGLESPTLYCLCCFQQQSDGGVTLCGASPLMELSVAGPQSITRKTVRGRVSVYFPDEVQEVPWHTPGAQLGSRWRRWDLWRRGSALGEVAGGQGAGFAPGGQGGFRSVWE